MLFKHTVLSYTLLGSCCLIPCCFQHDESLISKVPLFYSHLVASYRYWICDRSNYICLHLSVSNYGMTVMASLIIHEQYISWPRNIPTAALLNPHQDATRVRTDRIGAPLDHRRVALRIADQAAERQPSATGAPVHHRELLSDRHKARMIEKMENVSALRRSDSAPITILAPN